MMALSICASLCCLLAAAPASEYPFAPERPLDHMSYKGYATLSLEPRRVQRGQRVTMDLRFSNTGTSTYVLNPFFMGLWLYPGQIAIYDANKQYLTGYYASHMGSEQPINASSWVYIPGPSRDPRYIGMTSQFTPYQIPGTARPWPPGKYYLQAIFYNAFIGLDKRSNRIFGPKDGDEIRNHFDTTELFRSNVVEIELVEPEKAATQPATQPGQGHEG